MAASSHKRPLSISSNLIPNPLIKRRNLDWVLEPPASTSQQHSQSDESHPSSSSSSSSSSAAALTPAAEPTEFAELPRPTTTSTTTPAATTADIKSGAVQITDHLTHFASHLSSHILSKSKDIGIPRLSIEEYSSLYESSACNADGAHFVIHQHDHPIAGTHYDLRLQINETSSVSWAIMYGLPGDPNSIRLNRNATETRIHSLWNHLIETASLQTGSLLIWDTGTYSVLPRRNTHAPRQDPSSPPGSPHSPSSFSSETPQSLLHDAFRNRKICIRLHGTKLPDPYVINLRLTKTEDAAGQSKSSVTPRSKRHRRVAKAQAEDLPGTSSSESDTDEEQVVNSEEAIIMPGEEVIPNGAISTFDRELRELEDAQVRLTNAYPGASNTIDSIHQRKWYLSLDRSGCGFIERKHNGRSIWELPPSSKTNLPAPTEEHGHHDSGPEDTAIKIPIAHRLSFPFYVYGPDNERSVVTGRRSEEILRDEGITNFIPRKGWKPVLK